VAGSDRRGTVRARKAMSAATIQDRVVEFFTLREATRELAAVPEETRNSVFRGLRVAFQKREAAETLWPRGSTAEALRLALAALEGATAALAAFPTEPPPAWITRAQAIAAEASKRVADLPLPSLEKETLPAHEETFRTTIDSLIAIEELAGVKLAAPTDLRRIRNVRVTSTVVGALIALLVLVRLLHTPAFAKAVASGQHGPESGPEKAIDGDVTTFWALPDRVTQGWIDVELGKARAVHAIHLAPSNPPANDRGIKDARVEATLNGAPVKSVEVSFPEPAGNEPIWADVVLDAAKCDHLRITAKSSHKLGSAIGEIELK
jgi:F5/8 type C domain